MKGIGPESIALLQRLRAGIPAQDWQPKAGRNLLPRLLMLRLANYSTEIKGWVITEKGRQLLEDKGLL